MRALSNTVRSRSRGALLGGLVLLLLLASAPAALGVPASPDLLRRARHDKGLAARIAAFERNARARGVDAPRGKPAAALPGAPDLAPSVRVLATTGTLRSIALVVDFTDKAHAVPASSFDSLLFADVFGPSSLRGYYREVSYGSPSGQGLLTLTTEHPPSSIGSGWLRLPHTLAYYVSGGDNGTGSYPNNCQKMVEEAVALADPYVDFSRYDNDGDGEVDNLFVIHAGRGAEFTGSGGDIWSHSWTTSSPVSVDGVSVSVYSTEPEYWVSAGDMTTGVYAHEMGHVLGLPDLYDRDYSSAGIGEWSLMAGGSWNGPGGLGGSPARFDAWSAVQLGWVQPQTIIGDPATRTLGDVAASRTAAYKLYPNGGSGGSEYFLVENRQKTGTDAALPGSGLLVWHVDETRNNYFMQNDDETHKLVDLEEAAGTQSLDYLDAYGWPNVATADDPYPGTYANRALTDSTMPNARTYSGATSGVVVDQIGDSAATMSARFGSGGGTTDATPPHTTASGFDSEWHSTPVTVTFTATDNAGGSGVDYTEYKLDDLDWKQGTSVTLPAEPETVHTWTIAYRSVDKAGNVEDPPHTCQVKIDTRAADGDDDVPGVPTPSSPFNGTVDAASDRDDVYSIQLTAGETLRASITGPAGASDFDLYLYPPGTQTVNVDGGEVVKASTTSYPDKFSYLVPQSGTYYLHVFAYSGSGSYTVTYSVGVDTVGPVCAAKDVVVRRGRTCRVYFKVYDAMSAQVTTVVKITTRSGVVKKRWSWGHGLNVPTWWYAKYTCRLAKGRYRIVVTGRDLSGNAQSRIGRATLTVR